jgi:hypothetical protein
MTEFAEKAKTIGVSLRRGSMRTRTIRNEDNGRRAGYEVEHWDDHTDAVAQPGTVKLKAQAVLEE